MGRPGTYDQGDPEGAYQLAHYYKEKKDSFRMKFYYAKAIYKGHVESMFELADYYRESLEKEEYRSDKKTIEELMNKYYRMASNHGHQGAIAFLI
jgi:TPR repeat protein